MMLQFGNYDLNAPKGKKINTNHQNTKTSWQKTDDTTKHKGTSWRRMLGVSDFWKRFLLQPSSQECSSMAMLLALPTVPHPKYHWLCHPQFSTGASCALINLLQEKRWFRFDTLMKTFDAIILSITTLPRLINIWFKWGITVWNVLLQICEMFRSSVCRCEIPHLLYSPHPKDPYWKTTAKIRDCPRRTHGSKSK